MKLSSFSDKFRRGVRRCGFGVHSPFAFSFLADATRNDRLYAYYAYERIEELTSERQRAEFLKLLFRVAVKLKCRWFETQSADTAETLTLAGVQKGECPDIMVLSDNTYPEKAEECAAIGGTVVFEKSESLNDDFIKSITDKFDYGMTFCAEPYAVFVCRKELPKQWFDI